MVRIDDVTGLYAAGWFCVDEVVSAELDPLDATADCTGRSAEVCPVAAIQLGVEAGLDFGRSGEWIATTEDPGCCCPCGAGYQDSERAFRMWRESEPDGYCECWDPSHVTEYLCCAAGGR
ncbi:MAG: hypothetical protein D6798_11835 [Deltaproteobacteria bacterium]|nr:MAG: hypothetical protein D6798_11835 [Deltaproteobacteria bacterium]